MLNLFNIIIIRPFSHVVKNLSATCITFQFNDQYKQVIQYILYQKQFFFIQYRRYKSLDGIKELEKRSVTDCREGNMAVKYPLEATPMHVWTE